MKQAFKNFWQHKGTTAAGAALGIFQLAQMLSGAGVHVGHVGHSDVLGLIVAVGTMILGGVAQDPKKAQ